MIDHHGNAYYVTPATLEAEWHRQAARIADLELRNKALEELVERMMSRCDWQEMVDIKMDNVRWRAAMRKCEDIIRTAAAQ